jgi:diguanylate cyclase (GGDEF)-like protein
MEYGYLDATKKIIDAATLYAEKSDIAHAARVLNEIKIEYYSIVNDEDNLIETLKSQNAVFKRQKYEQKKIYLNSMKLIELVGKLHDEESAMRLENEHLFIQARTDQLTGLPNRFAMDQKLSQLFESAYRNSRKLGVGILDIDDFKQYNDNFGHQVGDDCLEKIGEVLKSFGDKDGIYCARYGGDEFVIIFENKSDEEIEEIAKRMYDAVRRSSVSSIKDGERSYLTVSQGVCNDIPRMKSKVWDFLSTADKAMYSVKRDKKKMVEVVSLPEFG